MGTKKSVNLPTMSGLDHGPLTAAPLAHEQARSVAALLHALADPNRVLIVSALLHSPAGELNGRELLEVVDLRQPTVSHHVRKLVRAGIVERDQRGPYAYFRVAPEALAKLRALFAESG
jgi:ArsR family transcriptional regulator, arsenate/arsenite/antimonite-responsive transcriptional repressor